MSRKSRSDVLRAALAVVAALAVSACAGGSGGSVARLDPVLKSSPARAALPDDAERAAAQVVAFSFADREDAAAQVFRLLGQHERQRPAGPTGLADNAEALLHAAAGPRTFEVWTREQLDEGVRDPALLLSLERYLDSRPLEVAKARLHDDRRRKLGGIINQVIEPLAKLAQGVFNPFSAVRSALMSLLSIEGTPEATTQERQALRAYRDFVEQYPDAPGADEAVQRITHYQDKVRTLRFEREMEAAEVALEAGYVDAALPRLERAGRLDPENPRAQKMRIDAEERIAERDDLVRLSLGASSDAGDRSPRVVTALLVDPIQSAAALALDPVDGEPAEDELSFVAALPLLEQGEEDAFFAAMREVAEEDPTDDEMPRHAVVLLTDPEQNPYAHYLDAKDVERGRVARWLFLGKFANGARDRDLPAPIEWTLDVIPMGYSILMTPIRALGYPTARVRFDGPVLGAGERYLAHFPDGQHAGKVREDLENRYERGEQWGRALAVHEARSEPDPEVVADYRERIAERSVGFAEAQPRAKARRQIYRAVASEYPETEGGRRATRLLGEELEHATPQEIRVSREFLEENPAVWAPGALALRPELIDGRERNGEIDEPGVTLLGGTVVRFAMVDADPVTVSIPKDQFARFVAALEEASNRQLATDERELAQHDPQRDLFFERAKLGLLDQPDMRPAALSNAVFLGSTEKFGSVRRRESVLPVDVVLQGGLEDFGFAALPRVRVPHETPDSFLYR
ncbi:MAG: hypothetical protein JRG76_00065 [Deltaproteobacteria bacterium]|nr:hypothetical protein [Deltaproteobacteria bacterium]MBW2412873.1 hypothetical protein [Deltaproteobacteria bacterium]